MSVLLIVGDSANSYVTVEEADAYFLGRFAEGAGWSAFSTVQKETRLIHATRLIDLLRFIGVKVDVDQPLQWPRDELSWDKVPLTDGVCPQDGEVPVQIKNGQCELALVVFDSDGNVPVEHGHTDSGAPVKSEGIGDYNVSYGEQSESEKNSEVFPIHFSRSAMMFLYPFLEWDSNIFRE